MPLRRRAVHPLSHKIRSQAWLVRQLRRRHPRSSIVFTNGCFDLLHVGHISLLEQARELGDVLVVGLNSDRSVRALKGPTRPIVTQQDRARVLAALKSVDYVTIFNARTPLALITALKPNVLVKGADWGRGEIVGRRVVERHGGRVVRVPLKAGHSTTRLVQRLRRAAPRAR